ncbi:hypothetical protein QAD02_023973 [Eretmocerus hayati]|uniref:Uncharacterized protein n=1 Tax=Eretmocerus hayati TaxID=131215 RepID=A0ACC2PXG5_9HYME|nr:hypothetical protein QAD02_023973 [Eretmocerus hayati]
MSDCGDYGGDSGGGDSYSGGGDDYSSSYNEPSEPSYSSYNDTPSYTEPSRDDDRDASQSNLERSETHWSYSGQYSSDSKDAERSEDSKDQSTFFENIKSFFGGSSDREPPSKDLQPPLEDSREFTTRASEESELQPSRLESIRSYLRESNNASIDPEPPSQDLQPPLEDPREFKTRDSEYSELQPSHLESIRSYLRKSNNAAIDPEPPSSDFQPPLKDSREFTTSHEPNQNGVILENPGEIRVYSIRRYFNGNRKVSQPSYAQQPTGI